MKLAVALERPVAGGASSTRENNAWTLVIRHFGSGPDGRTRSFESVLGANVDRLRVFLIALSRLNYDLNAVRKQGCCESLLFALFAHWFGNHCIS